VLALIERKVFSGVTKNKAAAHIFVILCAYLLINSTYTLIFYDVVGMLFRTLLSLIIIMIFVTAERSPLSDTATAFLSPTLMSAVIIYGAFYFNGDSLFFSYTSCIALISMTYFSSRGLAAHIITVAAIISLLLFAFGVNLMGPAFTTVYNVISFMACLGMNALAYSFCVFCANMLNALTDAKNEATLASQAKGTFLATMSHEIRTPLNAIIGLTEAELRRDLPQEDLDNLKKIHASGNLLIGIINDILDISKIESGKFELVLEEYTLADMIYDTATLNSVRIGSKPVEFIVSVDDSIPSGLRGDELRIKQLLSNMLSNAFKYTQKGSVELRVSWHPDAGGARLIMAVIDSGMGILPDDLEKLFTEYSQVNKQANRGIEGTGLGLSICKGLTEMMDGKITAESEYGKGSIFTAEIVQEITDATPVGADVAAALHDFTYLPQHTAFSVHYVAMPHAKVLVVDDVELNLDVAVACLSPYEMQVDCVDSGYAAVDRIKEGEPQYDLILMDHMMPGMDGIETARVIREIATDYAVSIPIIALTANALAGNDRMFAENGFQGFLGKPIEPVKLDAVLHKWVQQSD